MIVSAVLWAGGCAAAATPSPSAPPTPVPTPVITPDPHLTDPADLDTIFAELSTAGIRITPINAVAANEPVRRINATYLDWPIIVSEFSSGPALLASSGFRPDRPPVRGDAPFTIVGLNIMVEYGPKVTNAASPAPPAQRYRDAVLELALVLDPLLGPLTQRSVVPLPLPTASPLAPAITPGPSPAPS